MITKDGFPVNRNRYSIRMWGIWWGSKKGVGRETLYNAALYQKKKK
jgi:hypothetical protein